MEKLSDKLCETCGGTGVVQREVDTVETGCCGHALPNGECCGNAIPIRGSDLIVEQCADCQGHGRAALSSHKGSDQ